MTMYEWCGFDRLENWRLTLLNLRVVSAVAKSFQPVGLSVSLRHVIIVGEEMGHEDVHFAVEETKRDPVC